VISSFGDERWIRPRLLGVERNEARRDRIPNDPLIVPVPLDAPNASVAPWYLQNEPIRFDGRPYIKYGLSRPLAPGDVTRVGSLDGVALYAETGATELVEVLYVPVAPGFEFQPYQASGSPPCYDLRTPLGRR
jgi:hypothetical protein